MKEATLCFVINNNKILLGLKKRGFGYGKLNGFGGKIQNNESIKEAAIRELYEEAGIKARDPKKVGEITFTFPYKKEWGQIVHVFIINNWEGEPIETEEMKPGWFDISKIPFEEMWQDDQHWLPLVLQEKKIKGNFSFKDDNETILKMSLQEIDKF